MNVYIQNEWGQQTVRYLPCHKAIWLRLIVWKYPKEKRPIVRFLF